MIRKFFIATFALLGSYMPAFASFHGAAPADMGFFSRMAFEVEHYVMHMGYTFDGLALMVSQSPTFGMAYLTDSVACSSASPMVAYFFETPAWSIGTFFVSLGLLAFAGYQAFAGLRATLAKRAVITTA